MTAPDLVLLNASVFDGRPQAPTRGAVAVHDGRIVARGTDDEISALRGEATQVVDCRGGLLSPGFTDSHIHPVYAGTQMIQCDLHEVTTAEASIATVAAYAKENPDKEWVLGGGWSMEAFPGGIPTAAMLDSVVPDRPVFLPNRDGHGGWVNSEALRRAGITRDTPDPADGRIERDEDGEPIGCLQEGAMALVRRLVPDLSDDDNDRGLQAAQRYLFSLGITGWQDAIISDSSGRSDNMAAYLRADAAGSLKARVVGALWWDRERGADQIPELVQRRGDGSGRRFRATSVKIMQDGVAENFTAAMTEPYLDACGCQSGNAGISFVEPKALRSYVTDLDKLGFQVHFHALGDRAVREALDALQAARETNGMNDLRHHLAHIQVVHPDDIVRFAQLSVLANMQPLWACHEPQMDELTIPFLGEPRWRYQYPFGDLLRAGATLVGGSDWSVSSPDVMWGAHVAVTRTPPPFDAHDHGDEEHEPFLPEQQLSLAQALSAYTHGSALVNHAEQVVGTLDVGKEADLVVLDRDPFAGRPEDIHAAHPVQTYVAGELVWSSDGAA